MAKQKNRLTTTRQVLAGERSAYPVPTIHPQKTVGDETRILLTLEPTLDHISRPNRNLARTKLAYPTPLASRFDSADQIRQPENRPPDRPNLSYLPCTTLTLACTGADIKLNQDKPAYPRPHTSHIIDRPALESILEPTMSKQPTLHRPTHSRPDSTELLSTEFHQV